MGRGAVWAGHGRRIGAWDKQGTGIQGGRAGTVDACQACHISVLRGCPPSFIAPPPRPFPPSLHPPCRPLTRPEQLLDVLLLLLLPYEGVHVIDGVAQPTRGVRHRHSAVPGGQRWYGSGGFRWVNVWWWGGVMALKCGHQGHLRYVKGAITRFQQSSCPPAPTELTRHPSLAFPLSCVGPYLMACSWLWPHDKPTGAQRTHPTAPQPIPFCPSGHPLHCVQLHESEAPTHKPTNHPDPTSLRTAG